MTKYTRNSTPTDTDIVSLTDLKTFMKVDGSDEDTLIATLFTAAREMVEGYTNTSMNDDADNYTLNLDAWPDSGVIRVGVGPLVSVTSVKYYDSDDAQQTLAVDTDYYVDAARQPGQVVMKSMPALKAKPNAIEVIVKAGYNEAAVPKALVNAIQQITLNFYERRGDGQSDNKLTTDFPLPFQIKAMMNRYKLGGYG